MLAGPDQVENRLHIDSNQVTPLLPSNFARGYFDWKDRIKSENGVGFGGDYSFAWLSASDSLGEDTAFGGMYRMFGSWEVTSDGKGNSGALIWKVEHRHAYGSNVPPGSLGFEIGYVGLFLPPFSDQGARLTHLAWKQSFSEGRGTFVVGFNDVTDYVDVYALASPWLHFMNLAFSTGSGSIDLPNDASIGIAGGLAFEPAVENVGPVAALSGGERARLALARLVVRHRPSQVPDKSNETAPARQRARWRGHDGRRPRRCPSGAACGDRLLPL